MKGSFTSGQAIKETTQPNLNPTKNKSSNKVYLKKKLYTSLNKVKTTLEV